MANRLVVVVSDTNGTIADIINKSFKDSAGTLPSLNKISNYIMAIASGAMTGASVEVTVRDTDPAVATHGTGSVQATLSHL